MNDDRMRMEALFGHMLDNSASDLHLAVGAVPQMRVYGHLKDAIGYEPLTEDELRNMVYSVIPHQGQRHFEEEWELDFSVDLGISRFRGNVLLQRGKMGAVFRAIPSRALTLDELGLPRIIKELANKSQGLILVCGPSGSGKSTTLAAIIDYINETRAETIITVEDPIEFVHANKKCLVRQRELGSDTKSFAHALKHAMRQDPDVLMVGEMRDLETIALTITAAETGHLALGTLHTLGAAAAIDRIIDVFPPHQQQQIRMQLSMTLVGVVSQTLIPLADGMGRVLAPEVLLGTHAIRNLIREGKSHQVASMMHQGAAVGMVTLESSLKRLVEANAITLEEAMGHSNEPGELKKLVDKPRAPTQIHMVPT